MTPIAAMLTPLGVAVTPNSKIAPMANTNKLTANLINAHVPSRRVRQTTICSHIVAVPDVVALDDVLVVHFLAGALVDPLETDPIRRALLEVVPRSPNTG